MGFDSGSNHSSLPEKMFDYPILIRFADMKRKAPARFDGNGFGMNQAGRRRSGRAQQRMQAQVELMGRGLQGGVHPLDDAPGGRDDRIGGVGDERLPKHLGVVLRQPVGFMKIQIPGRFVGFHQLNDRLGHRMGGRTFRPFRKSPVQIGNAADSFAVGLGIGDGHDDQLAPGRRFRSCSTSWRAEWMLAVSLPWIPATIIMTGPLRPPGTM